MPDSPVLGIDVSNYSGELSPAQLDGLKAANIKHICVRLSVETVEKMLLARRQLRACADAGFSVSGYFWAYPDSTPADLATALKIAQKAGVTLTMLWLDAEEEGVTVGILRSLADACKAMGQRVGLYSGAWFLADLGDLTPLGDLPLWMAFYDGVADLTAWQPFGPWTTLAGKQYQGDAGLANVPSVDLDVFDASVV